MLAASHTAQHSHSTAAVHGQPVCCTPATAEPAGNLLRPAARLRRDDLKLAVRFAYGYASGGEKIDVIAIDLGVSRGKAAKMLSPNYPDAIGAVHLARIAERNPVAASRLGISGRVAA